MPEQAKIVVLGVGNIIRGDDGLGVRAAEALQAHPRLNPGIAVHDIGTTGLGALFIAAEASHLLFLDAVDIGAEPSTLICLSGAEISNLKGGKTSHDLGIVDLIAALRLTGRAPERIVLLGLQPQDTGIGTKLSPIIAENLHVLVEAALRQVEGWSTCLPDPPLIPPF